MSCWVKSKARSSSQAYLHANIHAFAVHTMDTQSCKSIVAFAKTPLLVVKESECFMEGEATSKAKIIFMEMHNRHFAYGSYFGQKEDSYCNSCLSLMSCTYSDSTASIMVLPLLQDSDSKDL